MTSKFSSAFDDLLAKNESRMDELLGAPPSSVLPTKKAAPVQRRARAASGDDVPSTVVNGTVGGVPFRLTTK